MSDILHSRSSLRAAVSPMLYASLEPALREEIEARTHVRRFADGQIIQQRGEDPDGFWLIEHGMVVAGQFLAEGTFRAVAVLGPGDSYGELAMFSQRPRVVDAVSRGASTVRFIPAGLFLECLARHPASGRALLGALSVQVQELINLVVDMRRGTATTRMALLLSNMSQGFEADGELPVTQQELAELLGVTRPTANTALRELAAAGLIERGYGQLRIRDRAALARFALG
ncbi:Crp/Fnr family transcriptional regulator [Qipengyuania mesophila]|uniref:Crp/Fnr family transcriptional regulator n=1 Tax=Qipengyuania mesophila TaxID=2867246 RepID=UPI0035135279